MTTTARTIAPSRWLRTLPWLGGLMLGTGAHLLWWTHVYGGGGGLALAPASQPIEVHVHVEPPPGFVPATGPSLTERAELRHRRARRGARGVPCGRAVRATTPPPSARGAVVCTDDGCSIRRSFLEELVRRPELLARGARFRPASPERGPRGIRVQSVSTGSLADLLGLARGDIVTAIDGQSLESLEALLDRVHALPEARVVTLAIDRRGERHILRFRVVDG